MRPGRAAAAALATALAACAAPREPAPRTPIASTVRIAPETPPAAPYDLADALTDGREAAPRIWLFRKDGLSLALFGTVHATPRGARWLSPAAHRAFEAADLVLTEVAATEAAQYNPSLAEIEALAPLLLRQDGLDTRDLVAAPGTPERRALDAALEMTRLSPEGTARARPWTTCVDLFHGPRPDTPNRLSAEARAQRAAAARAIGPLEAASPDARIERARVSRGLAHSPLETLASRARIHAAMDEGEALTCIRILSRRIAAGSDYPDMPRRFHEALEGWRRGDAEGARRSVTAYATGITPGFAERLLQARERDWLALIGERCEAARLNCAVAVGFGHLGGADGLIEGLKAMGWRLQGGES